MKSILNMNIGKLLCEYRNLDELKETELKGKRLKETEFNQFNQKLNQSKKTETNKGNDDRFIIFQWPWII